METEDLIKAMRALLRRLDSGYASDADQQLARDIEMWYRGWEARSKRLYRSEEGAVVPAEERRHLPVSKAELAAQARLDADVWCVLRGLNWTLSGRVLGDVRARRAPFDGSGRFEAYQRAAYRGADLYVRWVDKDPEVIKPPAASPPAPLGEDKGYGIAFDGSFIQARVRVPVTFKSAHRVRDEAYVTLLRAASEHWLAFKFDRFAQANSFAHKARAGRGAFEIKDGRFEARSASRGTTVALLRFLPLG